MPRDLFGLDSTYTTLGSRQWYAMPFAVLTHTVILGSLVAVPLLATHGLPGPKVQVTFVPQPPAPAPVPPPVTRQETPPPVTVEPLNADAAPTVAPDRMGEEQAPTLASLVVINQPVAAAGGRIALAAPPPPVPIVDPPSAPLRVGGDIKEPKRIEGPAPVYPLLARAARAEGAVILEAIIGKDGAVRDVRVLRSAAMFDEAALAAVRQWRYTVPMLNGEPIEVVMTVTVYFGMPR